VAYGIWADGLWAEGMWAPGVWTVGVAAPTVSINGPDVRSVAVGKTRQLYTTVSGSPTPDLTWSSDDEDVATVDEYGLVTGVALGSCTITVLAENSEGTDEDSITLNVIEASETGSTVLRRRRRQHR
jgi:uncharacterized protein YjdB